VEHSKYFLCRNERISAIKQDTDMDFRVGARLTSLFFLHVFLALLLFQAASSRREPAA
jgi:hypothetical protein